MALDLFAHNQKAYAAAVEMLGQYGKAAIVHPTGTGKSFIAFQLVEDNPNAVVLWLSPNEYIYKTQLESAQKVDPLFDGTSIRFYTYAKLTMFSEGELAQLAAEKPAYIILDELHRAGAPCWQKPVETLLRLCPEAKLLGLTATNIRYLDNNRDMTEELFDGCIASEMTLGEAIVRGILPAPKYVTTVFRYQSELAKYQKRIDNTRAPGTEEQNQQYLDALRRALEQADGLDKVFAQHMENKTGKYIVFCASLAHMREMVAHVPEWFAGVNSEVHIYRAYSDDPETSRAFAKFKADESSTLKLLFCIDMLNEGVHVKGVSGVILFRPTSSPIIFKQQIGRALTSGDSATPLILNVVNNIENLYSIDFLREEMQTAVQRLYVNGESDSIVTERFEIIEQVRDCRKLFERLENSLSNTWEQYYAAASVYYAKHGNLQVPARYVTPAGLSLGHWVGTQRKVRAGKENGNLTEQKIARLDQIGMVWQNRDEISWERGYQAACSYYEKHGDLQVSYQYVNEDGFALGRWVSHLRFSRANGERSRLLTKEHIQALDEMGMVWSAVSSKWERNYAEAAAYYERHGNLFVPVNYVTETGFKPGAWLVSLRMTRIGKSRLDLSEDKIRRLDEIGMEWGDRNENRWMQSYAEAKRYYEKNGNLKIPTDYVTENGVQLERRVRLQKRKYNSADKNPRRAALLTQIGVELNCIDPWAWNFELLERYREQYGNVNVPRKYETAENICLGRWLYVQQKALADGKLPADRAEKLLKLGVKPTDSLQERWQKKYRLAAQYFEENGTLDIPEGYVSPDGVRLGLWIKNQRSIYQRGEMPEERIRLLEKLQIDWDEKRKSAKSIGNAGKKLTGFEKEKTA